MDVDRIGKLRISGRKQYEMKSVMKLNIFLQLRAVLILKSNWIIGKILKMCD